MDIFLATDIQEIHSKILLNEEESFHIAKVLRKKEGELIGLINGFGVKATAKIISVNKNQVLVEVTQREEEQNSNILHIAIAPTKNIDRYEYFLEKATEIGVKSITPIFTKNSERKNIKLDRLQKIILAATKQSGRSFLPILNEPVDFSHFISKSANAGILNLIAVCGGERISWNEAIKKRTKELLVLIGPEGDFTPEEIKLATGNHFLPISLGNTRLRVETAGVLVCSWVKMIEN